MRQEYVFNGSKGSSSRLDAGTLVERGAKTIAPSHPLQSPDAGVVVRFSSNVSALKPSATLAITARARKLRSEGRPIIDLSAGEPSFATPEVAAEGSAAAVRAGRTGYPPTPGFPELREGVTRYLIETSAHAPDDPAGVLISAGVKQALFNLCFSLFGEGDEVLIPSPFWTSYLAIVELSRATPVVVPTSFDEGFALTVDRLESMRTPATRGLFLNSPSNPSGAVMDLGTLEKICAWAGDHGIWILSDEIYRRLHYGGSAAPSVFDVEDRPEHVVAMDGMSKAFSMPGWRIGWAVGPPGLIKKASDLQSQTTSAAAGPSQFAAAAVLASEGRETVIAEFKEILDRRRRSAHAELQGIEGFEVPLPPGAIYLYGRISGGDANSASVAEALLQEAGVACVPGEAFGTPGFLRLNFSVADEVLARGAELLSDWFSGR
jgi:aspartate/methionine/tyrosine aminotransferase